MDNLTKAIDDLVSARKHLNHTHESLSHEAVEVKELINKSLKELLFLQKYGRKGVGND